MGDARTQSQVISAARFYIEFSHIGRIAFSELGGITTKVSTQEYIYNDDQGKTVHTKQYGKTEPPTITLKRALDADGNAKLMAWHALSRNGDPSARTSGTLVVMDASGNESSEITYNIHGGWCSELQITSMKAGEAGVAMIECKITCEEIGVPEAGMI
jgi:phage tail-like protein